MYNGWHRVLLQWAQLSKKYTFLSEHPRPTATRFPLAKTSTGPIRFTQCGNFWLSRDAFAFMLEKHTFPFWAAGNSKKRKNHRKEKIKNKTIEPFLHTAPSELFFSFGGLFYLVFLQFLLFGI